MRQRDVGRDGGVGQVAFVILLRPAVHALEDSISGLKAADAGRTGDMSVHVLRDSISGLKAADAGRTELYGVNPQFDSRKSWIAGTPRPAPFYRLEPSALPSLVLTKKRRR